MLNYLDALVPFDVEGTARHFYNSERTDSKGAGWVLTMFYLGGNREEVGVYHSCMHGRARAYVWLFARREHCSFRCAKFKR